MPGVPRELIDHALSVDPKAKPVKQPLRRFDEPKRKVIASELHRLENARFIREIKTQVGYRTQLSYPRRIQTYREYVSTIHLSISIAQRIPSLYPASIR
jgi:hypothetical protein